MNVSRHPLLGRALALGAIGLGSLLAAAPAAAEFDPRQIPYEEKGTTPEQANHCAKLEIVYARGTDEPGANSWALNGYNGPNYGTDALGSSHKSPYAIFYTIARDLGNRMVTVNGVPQREYVTVYPESAGDALKGRSDFALWNVPYPADLTFLTNWSWGNSIQRGTKELILHLNAETDRCPQKKFLLFGYSQGSLVVANAISKPAQRKYIWNLDTHPLPVVEADTVTAIKAVGLLADAGFNSTETLTFTANGAQRTEYERHRTDGTTVPATTPWNIDANTLRDVAGRRNAANQPLTGTVRGQIEAPPTGPNVGGKRSNDWMLPHFTDRIRSFCILADPICNRSSTNANAHLLYFNDQTPRQNIAIFAVKRLRADDPRWNGVGLGAGYTDRLTPNNSLLVP